jgi:alpha-tubulin suppressor-like RCC1 family protein
MYEEDEQIDIFEEKDDIIEIGDPNSCLLACGRNKYKELSIKDHETIFYPSGIKEPKNRKSFQIAVGATHTAILTTEGYLYMVGSTLHGKIGIHGLPYNNVIKPKLFPISKERCVTEVQCSEFHTLCLFEDGEVFSWGGTLHGKLGGAKQTPSLVTGIGKVTIKKIGCGRYHSMALSSNLLILLSHWLLVLLGRRRECLQ